MPETWLCRADHLGRDAGIDEAISAQDGVDGGEQDVAVRFLADVPGGSGLEGAFQQAGLARAE